MMKWFLWKKKNVKKNRQFYEYEFKGSEIISNIVIKCQLHHLANTANWQNSKSHLQWRLQISRAAIQHLHVIIIIIIEVYGKHLAYSSICRNHKRKINSLFRFGSGSNPIWEICNQQCYQLQPNSHVEKGSVNVLTSWGQHVN